VVTEETERIHDAKMMSARLPSDDLASRALGSERAAALDRFDRVQLEDVLVVCREARSLSVAGRVLFAESRSGRTSVNDADRLRKYLARFELEFSAARSL
jgi:transcriptional regulatory protein RtcR